ncbi:unnamed protein product [Pseudo-nitzschia multistriata]|uniref:Uncharacterized protein n=1 Tax=Pseudo-nitzschia multistriata TaxID=183589 RepID=A0A448ZBI7_9STRA|nr:unnamed protein product [Pseudo-nitzschia multistriata]
MSPNLNTSPHQDRRRQRQYVWFVRYGLTEHPLVEDLGPYDSDIDPMEGIDHAKNIAKRIAAGIHNIHETSTAAASENGIEQEVENNESLPTVVYASPFLRTAHTGYIIANELQNCVNENDNKGTVELRVEEGLWEWLIPSLLVTKCDGIKTNPRPLEVLSDKLLELEQTDNDANAATIALNYNSVNPYDDSGDEGMTCVPVRTEASSPQDAANGDKPGQKHRPRWIESESDLLKRCETTLEGLLSLHPGGNSFCIVSHAPCDQAMAFALEQGAATPEESNLAPWPLGGITVFSRPVGRKDDGSDDSGDSSNGEWTMDLYGNTEHMPGDYKAGLKEWSLPCFAKK